MANMRDVSRNLSESAVHHNVRTALSRLRVSRCLGIKQGTTSWYKFRANHITSTDAAEILSKSESARQRIIASKHNALANMGKAEGLDSIAQQLQSKQSSVSSPAIRHGHKYEPVAAAAYAHVRQCTLAKLGVIEHPEYSWLSASPDRIDITHGTLVEIKCPYTRRVPSPVPRKHWIQMQIAMACSGIHRCTYVELSVSPSTRPCTHADLADNVIYYRDILYDETWFQENVRALYDIHAHINRISGKRISVYRHTSVPHDNDSVFTVNSRTVYGLEVDMQGRVANDVAGRTQTILNHAPGENQPPLPPLQSSWDSISNDIQALPPLVQTHSPAQQPSSPAQDTHPSTSACVSPTPDLNMNSQAVDMDIWRPAQDFCCPDIDPFLGMDLPVRLG